MRNAALKLSSSYPEDLSIDIATECEHFRMFIKEEKLLNVREIYAYIKHHSLEGTFPNLYTALKMYLTIPVTNCSAERDFSVLSRIKNAKRATLLEGKLNALIIMCTEKDLTQRMDFEEVIEIFSKTKSRRKPI
ncbi:Hypothetical protein NTJ_07618 [Nesidiocoris tenuis]|uniref:HAT C-terminal dimerisation domain-containing protein n=1 Tax=Nesidiocoris tenuis TaxID=355587 RepID=A0ABN7ARH3_9HEMI|nr:Hypothetical protein NTJ_07618 [Nesidiocoris tenuis]